MLKEIRRKKGYTQKSIAVELGVSQQAVSNWECGLSEPSVDMMISMTKIFNCTLDDLVKGEEDVKIQEK